MTNFFAALDDSDDERVIAPAPVKEKTKSKKPSKPLEPSKQTNAPRKNGHGDRKTKKGRAPVRDGKRQYDRRSGTGRGREIKKGGGGARNWGSDKDAAKKAEHSASAEKAAAEADDSKLKSDEITEEAPEAEPEPKEVEPVTFSLDEYLAEKAKIQSSNDLFAPKEAKVLESEFAGKAVAAKEADELYFGAGGGKKLRKKNKEKKEVEKLIPSFKVSTPQRPDDRRDGRRGDRRGGRGNRRDGGRKFDRKPDASIDTNDSSAFPSL